MARVSNKGIDYNKRTRRWCSLSKPSARKRPADSPVSRGLETRLPSIRPGQRHAESMTPSTMRCSALPRLGALFDLLDGRTKPETCDPREPRGPQPLAVSARVLLQVLDTALTLGDRRHAAQGLP